MDRSIKEKIRTGALTDRDVRRIIDWQLSLTADRIDCQLLGECLLFLYPGESGLTPEQCESLFARLSARAFGMRRTNVSGAQHHRRRPTRTLLIALLITLLVAGVAIAATLGVFDRFIDNPHSEMSRGRLQHLAQVGNLLGQTVTVQVPSFAPEQERTAEEAQETLYARLVRRQAERGINLTMDQVYCDGNNLYYSYQLTDPGHMLELGAGKPTGFDEWENVYPGMTIRDVHFTIGEGEEESEEIAQWLCAGGPRYAVYDHVGMGDGASLDDGTEKGRYLAIMDSNSEYLDAFTQQGFQQVELPQDYVPGESIDVLMPVSIFTMVAYQDETGLYTTVLRNPQNRGYHHVPVTAAITGKPEELSARAVFDEYTATAQLAISDVDIGGDVYIDAPQAWLDDFEAVNTDVQPYVMDYVLIADGVECRNVDGGFGVDRETGRWQVFIRYDLPESTESLVLVPRRHGVGLVDAERIVLR